jgi:hypothetical protein
MSSSKTVNLSTQMQPLSLNTPTVALTPSNPRRAAGKVVLECPRCCWIFEVQSPDRRHPACAFSKPDAAGAAVIEEPRVCRNPKCKKHFSLYWHKPAGRASA